LFELYSSRIKKLKSLLDVRKIQNFLVTRDQNILYLTGFYGKDSGSLLLITDDRLHLLVNLIYLEQSRKSIKNKNINIICCRKDKFKTLAEILENYYSRLLGFEGMNINFSDFCKLEKILSKQNKKLINIDGIVEKLREVKDKTEINKIRDVCRITDKVFNSLINSSGYNINKLSEIELAYKIEELFIKNGSDGRSFDTIVAGGKNSSMPHYLPGKLKLIDGPVVMDFGCRFKNYCSDITRTIFLRNGKIYNEFKKIYDIVLKAQLLAIKNCREGISCSHLDKIARGYIASKGYGNNFGHGLGHGVGLEVHEQPVVNSRSRTTLKKNMVITIEPGIYIENIGGIRIEDMVVVDKNKCEVLYSSTKNFVVLG